MSINLHLNATRTLYTKKGKPIEETKKLDLIQTPTIVTNEILESNNFEEILDSYCDYAKKYDVQYSERPGYYFVAVVSDKTYSIGDYYEEGEHVYKIDIIITPDNDMFEDCLHNGVGLYPDSDLMKDLLCLGLNRLPHTEELRYIIKQMKDDEWEFEFYAM